MRACVCVWLPEVWPREEQASSSRPDPRWSGDSVERLASSLTQEKTSCSARVSLVNTAQIGLGEYFSLGNSHFQKRAGCLPSLGWDLLIQKKKSPVSRNWNYKGSCFLSFSLFFFLRLPKWPRSKKKVCSPVFSLKSHLRGLTPTFKMPVQGLPPQTARGLQNSS